MIYSIRPSAPGLAGGSAYHFAGADPLSDLGDLRCLRRTPKNWWIFGFRITAAFHNHRPAAFTDLHRSVIRRLYRNGSRPLRDKLVTMAAQYDVPCRVYLRVQSAQNKRFPPMSPALAPPSHIAERCLLERTTEPEIMAVMGHELGRISCTIHFWIIGIMLLIVSIGLFLVSLTSRRV
jgi:hypothetical protein